MTEERARGLREAEGERDKKTWTLLEVLRWTTGHFDRAGIESARLDAEVLLAHALGCDRLRLYMDHERPLDAEERAAYRRLVTRRAQGEPAAYLIGEKEFYGRPFKVDPRVLVPRPETEHLVDAALEAIAGGGASKEQDAGDQAGASPKGEPVTRVLDLCTGSGCVAITLALERPELLVTAVELSPEACELARENAKRLGAEERVQVMEGDLFEPVRAAGRASFSAIVANPPYIRTSELAGLMRDVREHEPRMALESGPTGLELLERILREAPPLAAPGAHVILEHGEGQGDSLLAFVRADERYEEAWDISDHAGLDRVLVARIAR